ncbi:MAG: PDZ domain-containing protein [Thaumarchaeota archaeon]|nr:PDZ domain-containing protein [Nitrososphaerota archaeon]
MPSKNILLMISVSLIAMILASSSIYMGYNGQQYGNDQLRAAMQEVSATKQLILETSRKIDSLNQEIASLKGADSRNVVAEQQLNDLKVQLTSLTDRLMQQQSIIEGLSAKVGVVNSSVQAITKGLDVRLAEINVSTQVKGTPEEVYQKARSAVVVVRSQTAQGSSLGSGFVYSAGYIVTNNHVVQGARSLTVEFFDGTSSTATIAGQDRFADIAVLMVTNLPEQAKPLEIADSSLLKIGQQVVAVGNPLGLTASLSTGVVSQLGRLIGPVQNVPLVVPVIQLDVLITNGNSGGPLLDLQGKVVGITNAGTSGGINFAIPSNIAKRVADSIIKTGKYEHPFVGYTSLTLTADSIRTSNVVNVDSSTRGIMIVSVVSGSPAEKAGLIPAQRISTPNGQGYQANDIIVSVNGRQIRSLEEWSIYMEENVSPGQAIELGVLRAGSVITVTVIPTVRS